MPQSSAPIVSWTTEDLWNLLMREIEPDLCTDTMFIVDELYSNETEEEREIRIGWYEQAIELFTDRYHVFMNALKEEFQRAKRKLRTLAEKENEESDMQSAEANINSFGDA